MKDKVIQLIKIDIILILFISIFITNSNHVYAETFQYSDTIVENIASVIASEIGCSDSKDNFIYELIWAGVFVNNYNYWIEKRKTPSTVVFTSDNICKLLSYGGLYSKNYCYYTYAKRAANRGGDCTQEQKNQLNLAVKMVLSKSFNIPRNIYHAAEAAYAAKPGVNVVWADIQPTINGKAVGLHTYFSTDNNEQPKSEDVYGNTVSTDLSFYKSLAKCLYNNPTYGAYNNCNGMSETTKYVVYLYPNGGTGIEEGQKFEYNETTSFSQFPIVTKKNCTLDGWNVGSVDGKKYYQNVDSSDDGAKLYARWNCKEETTDNDTSDEPTETKYTVYFKLSKDTADIFYSEEVKSGSKVKKPTNPTKEGYDFIGWQTKDNTDFNFNTKINIDMTLYANWKLKNEISETPKQDKERQEVNSNSNTGNIKTTIFLLLIVPSVFGIYYYYKYYLSLKNNLNIDKK